MSEWGDWTNTGIELALNYARKLSEAHRVMQAQAWCMWEPDFLFERVEDRLQPNPAYYAVAQFTRFARPGMVAIDASDVTLKTTAYLDGEARQLVTVTVNDAPDAVEVAYDVSAFQGVGEVQAFRTSESESLAPLPEVSLAATTLPARSITTFVASYESLLPPLLANGGFETGRLDGWTGTPPDMTGVQDNYPHGGSCDGFIDLKPGATGSLSQLVTDLTPGARYALTAACAASGVEATLAVEGQDLAQQASVSGGNYQHVRLEFAAPADGRVTVRYSAGPSAEKQPWATLDSVRLSPLS
jgi:hypothetical protein